MKIGLKLERYLTLYRSNSERTGGRSKEVHRDSLDEALLKSKFWEPVECCRSGHNSRLFEDVPEDLSTLLPDIDYFKYLVGKKHFEISLRWVGLHATRKANNSAFKNSLDTSVSSQGREETPLAVKRVANQVRTRFWLFAENVPENESDAIGRLEKWYNVHPRTYADFRAHVTTMVKNGVRMEFKSIHGEDDGGGMRGSKTELKKYREELAEYEKAIKKGWTKYPNGNPVVPVVKPIDLGPLVKPAGDDGKEETEIVLDEVPSENASTRAYSSGYEDALDVRLREAARAFTALFFEQVPLKILEAKIARARKTIEEARAMSDFVKVEKEQSLLQANLAEIEYQTKKQAGQNPSRKDVAVQYDADHDQMSTSWQTSKATCNGQLANGGVIGALDSVGLTVQDLIEQLELDPGVCAELTQLLTSTEETDND